MIVPAPPNTSLAPIKSSPAKIEAVFRNFILNLEPKRIPPVVLPPRTLAASYRASLLQSRLHLFRRCKIVASVEEFARPQRQFRKFQPSAVKQETDSRRCMLFARSAMIAARAMLAVTLLLVLVAGSIVWPASASGSLCTMACCVGHAPHAAGSCVHGSGETEVNGHAQHSHHHQEQQIPTADSSVPRAFAGAMASAMGSDMAQVPTIDASEFSADHNAQVETKSQSAGYSISAIVLSAPCQRGCGVCTSGFSASKRSRDTSAAVGSNKAQRPSAFKLRIGTDSPIHPRSNFYRQVAPRGPPPFAG